MRRFLLVSLWLAVAGLACWRFATTVRVAEQAKYPAKPIHVVVPYTAGGGTDSFVRLMTQTIGDQELLSQPLVVMNQPGGSGTIGSRYVKDARPDGYRVLCHHESIITAKLAGTVNFGPEAFTPIAQTGNIVLLIVVRQDAPYESIRDFLEKAQAEPHTLRFGANRGSPAHFTALNLEATVPGAKLNLITSGGGQKRYIGLLGGHLDAGIFSLAEYLSFVQSDDTPPDKNIRALAVLSAERHPMLPGVPTCGESEIPVTSSNAYYWWAPAGTPAEVVDALAKVLQRAIESAEAKEKLAAWSIDPEFTSGDKLLKRLDARVGSMKPLASNNVAGLPNAPLLVGIVTLLLAGSLLFPVQDNKLAGKAKPQQLMIGRGVGCFLALILYVLSLHSDLAPFWLSTAVMVFVCGNFICAWQRERLQVLAGIGLLTGLGMELLFTQVFTVALP